MPDIQRLIELLQSDNPNKRYDAWEELRVSRQPLPQDAIDALQIAKGDSNSEVADAAQRALALHTSSGNEKEPVHGQEQTFTSTVEIEQLEKAPTIQDILRIGLFAGAFIGFIPIWIVLLLGGLGEGIGSGQRITVPIIILLVIVVLSIVGAGIGANVTQSSKRRWIGLWVGAILCPWIPIICIATSLL